MSDPFTSTDPFAKIPDLGESTQVDPQPLLRGGRLLPISLAALAVYGATLPWVTVRGFDNESSTYNLTDIRGGTGIIVTICAWMVIGIVISMFRELAGHTVLSLCTAVLGWMAGIAGILLGTVGSLIPSIELAGIDLTRAAVAQGIGVTVTVVPSLLLAFFVIRHYPPVSAFSTGSALPVLPIPAAAAVVLVAANMHAPWIVVGGSETGFRAYLSGNSLYGSGFVVVALWASFGLWLTALVLPRKTTMRVAGVGSVLLSLVLLLYVAIMWFGGKFAAWLMPSNVEQWTGISVQPMMVVVMIAAIGLGATGTLAFLPRFAKSRMDIDRQRSLGGIYVNASTVAAVILVLVVAASILFRALT